MEEKGKEIAGQNEIDISAREEKQEDEFQAKEAPSSLDKLVALLCQGSIYLGLAFVLPLIVLIVTDKDSKPFLWNHANQALLFQAALLIGSIVIVVITLGFGVVLLLFVIPLALLCNLKALYKAAIGEQYEYFEGM